ncbi:MAG: DUF885 domain-containing protein [Roseburia sp.]|nr:DUF885 domain-containing protein [Roseburia sp.]
MKKVLKTVAAVTGCALTLNTVCGCTRMNLYDDERMEELAEAIAAMFLGGDAYGLNVMTIDPKGSYDIDRVVDPRWYRYSELTDDDIDSLLYALRYYDNQLNKFKPSKLGAKSAGTYRYARRTIDTYLDYYGSPYVKQFDLIGADYINSYGGYVADFASMVENYAFRCKSDVDELLSMTEYTDSSFSTYLQYVDDRADAGFPLYYYTVNAMQEYLEDIVELGDEYYLYDFIDNKIDGATFLTAAEKARYKSLYSAALTDHFMTGVRDLAEGLNTRKGAETEVEQSYLGEYGAVGRAYYDWCFKNKTGLSSVNYNTLFNELIQEQNAAVRKMNSITASLDSLTEAEQADFEAYADGEKALLGLTDPDDMLAFLKTAAKSIVPDLKSTPTIYFKYMDSTVAEISNVLAYYLHSPADESNAAEHITINPQTAAGDPTELLTTIAHEGYPGHLYAYVNAKESGANIMSLSFSCLTFSEGWARYTEYAVLDYIASTSDDRAVKLFCEYKQNEMIASNLSVVLYDMEINYFGATVQDCVETGLTTDTAREIVKAVMEIPTTYVSYGYGLYFMVELHDSAKLALGDKYDEVQFNGKLLSEGPAPTLPRAREIIEEYIG